MSEHDLTPSQSRSNPSDAVEDESLQPKKIENLDDSENLSESLSNPDNSNKNIIRRKFSWLGNATQALRNNAENMIEGASKTISETVDQTTQALSTTVGTTQKLIGQTISEAGQAIGNAVADTTQAVASTVQSTTQSNLGA